MAGAVKLRCGLQVVKNIVEKRKKGCYLIDFCVIFEQPKPYGRMKQTNMSLIRYSGVIESISGNKLIIRIMRSSSCSTCEASNGCLASGKEETILYDSRPEDHIQKGDLVLIESNSSTGLKAVLWAYLLPVVVLLGTLIVSEYLIFPGREGWSALFSLGCTGLYFAGLIPFRKRLGHHFSLTVKPYDEAENVACNA
jgi:sigma-E factor negative regulatory protein RseC